MRIGVISDTHGLLRPEARAALNGVDRVLHAGDIGSRDVIEQLQEISPVTAIRGNIDTGAWALAFPETRLFTLGATRMYLLHNLKTMDIEPAARGVDVVISGHSHKPSIERRDGVLFLNPGSAGPRRFSLPIALAMLVLDGDGVDARIIELNVASGKRK